MGIQIVSQPVGAPIGAAVATAVGLSNQRKQQQLMEIAARDYERIQGQKYTSAEREKERTWSAQQDTLKFQRGMAATPMPDGVKFNPEMAKEYGRLQAGANEILAGGKFDPNDPTVQSQLSDIFRRMQEIRDANPEPKPGDIYGRGSFIADSMGKTVDPATGLPYSAIPPGGSVRGPTGQLDPGWMAEQERIAKERERALEKEKESKAKDVANQKSLYQDQKRRAEADLKEAERQVRDDESYKTEEARNAKIQELRDAHDRMWGTPPDFTAGTAQPSVVAPAPVIEPGRGQQLPTPTAPFQPPTQPLNLGQPGTPVLPGGPSQLAPPPRDYAQEVAKQQSGNQLNRMMDDMQKRGINFDGLSPDEKKLWLELERIYKGA